MSTVTNERMKASAQSVFKLVCSHQMPALLEKFQRTNTHPGSSTYLPSRPVAVHVYGEPVQAGLESWRGEVACGTVTSNSLDEFPFVVLNGNRNNRVELG